ncbi:MAG: NADH-quinone oxidoreductase subunit A [Candidatus Abyssobacteria bacterium SURF_17]|uniref:NADH-quinone oxidoreductase subunit A n=1 Tax=Candidatus Abyssobacteria bacterium SURF_17 TaxID=2093361 RepID=A0A419EWH8_9BACT|nr:MAG: NADH-quinone oxidoreductase subunit A [Candidatus Abyssubacteria bacterium SURF_17]
MSVHVPIFAMFIIAFLIGLGFLAVSVFLGPKRLSKQKLDPFDCGNPPLGTPRIPVSIKYYVVAILFILFDVEAVFLYVWAIVFKELGLFGFIEMLVFILILVGGLAYVWRKGALEWE